MTDHRFVDDRRDDSDNGTPTWIKEWWVKLIVIPLVLAAAGAIITAIVKTLWPTKPREAHVVVLDWRANPDTRQQWATAAVRVSNEGDAPATVCFVHWIAEYSPGLETEIGVSGEFSIRENEVFNDIAINRTPPPGYAADYGSYPSYTIYFYVQCGAKRYPNSPSGLVQLWTP